MKVDPPDPKKKGESLLALDIGTTAVKSLFFERKEGKTNILGGSYQYFDRFGVFDSIAFEEEVIKKAISRAVIKSQNGIKTKINSVLLQFPPNILKARVLSQSFSRENFKERIEREERGEILKKIKKGAEKEISQIYAIRMGILPRDIHLVDSEILEIKIDGYEVPDLFNYQGQNLDFQILVTFSFLHHFQRFFRILKDLNLKILSVRHEAQNLVDLFLEKERNALFIDVGGEISQVFLIQNGELRFVEDFEVGGENFTRGLSQNLGVTLDRARVLKEGYSQRALSRGVRKRIKEIFAPISKEWFFKLKSRLTKLKVLMPSKFFLFGGGSLLPEIKQILRRGKWENVSFVDVPQISLIHPKDLKNIVDKTKQFVSPKDIPLLLLSCSLS